MRPRGDLLAELPHLAPGEFVSSAYERILGRAPTADERERMMSALLQGEAPAWLLGSLRFGDEGSARATDVPGLRARYMAQRLFRLPVIGEAAQWLCAIARLPLSLRYLRALRQLDAAKREDDARRIAAIAERNDAALADLARQFDEALREIRARLDDAAQASGADRQRTAALEDRARAWLEDGERAHRETQELAARLEELRAKVEPILPPPLDDTLEIPGAPLVAVARERSGHAPETPVSSLSAAARYAMFETVFYESPAVAGKQRVYVPYLDRELVRQLPFLDLGCGRGEFLRILASEGVRAIGVDINTTSFAVLRAEGFDVVGQDLIAFLEGDRGLYSGASFLQVAEHLTHEQIERMLALIMQRLAPGAILILETPNPLSPFALGVFHTDPTHVAPLPPEAMRYAIEAAGFERTRTLFQARIPRDQFAGPDPRAYYADYAILAWRPTP